MREYINWKVNEFGHVKQGRGTRCSRQREWHVQMAWGWGSKMWWQNQENSPINWLEVVGMCGRDEFCEVHRVGL